MTTQEVADEMGMGAHSLRYHIRILGIDLVSRNKSLGHSSTGIKHMHLRKKVMTYFLTHSWIETYKAFDLTPSELKSLFTVGYRDKKLLHLRKDKRRNDVWSMREILFLIRASGIQNREWIAEKLDRGSYHSVKEQVKRMNTKTRYMNGLPLRLAEELLGVPMEGIRVKAGPSSIGFDGRTLLVPWVILFSRSKRLENISFEVRSCLSSMSKFQMMAHGTKTIKSTILSIQNILEKT